MKKKFNKKQKKMLDAIWGGVEMAQQGYWKHILELEALANKYTDIDIEIFHVDGMPVGFGCYERLYELYQK